MTNIDKCMRFPVDGCTSPFLSFFVLCSRFVSINIIIYSDARLATTLPPWLVALLSDFLVWKPLNEAHFKGEMAVFEPSEKRYNITISISLLL